MGLMHKERGNILIVVLALALTGLLALVGAAVVFTNVFDNIFTQQEAREEGLKIFESARESYEAFQREKDAMLEGFLPSEQEATEQEPRAPNAPFPQNPDEPLSNPLDASLPEPVLDPRHEDSIELIKPPDFGFEEVIVDPTPEPDSVTCPKGPPAWTKKYVGNYIYCVVPERPCLYASCTFSRYNLDGTIDIYVGKCQDEEYINPKSSAPLCSGLGI